MLCLWECLGKNVSNVIISCTVLYWNFVRSDMLSDEIVMDVNILWSSMKLWLFCEFDCSLVVNVDDSRAIGWYSKFGKKFLDPKAFMSCIVECHILSFYCRERNCRLFLWVPRDSPSSKHDSISWYWSSVSQVCPPISIRKSVGIKIWRWVGDA